MAKYEDWSEVPEELLLDEIIKLLEIPIEKQLKSFEESSEFPVLLYLLLILVVSREQRSSTEFTRKCCFEVYEITLNYLRLGVNSYLNTELLHMAWFLSSGGIIRDPQGIA